MPDALNAETKARLYTETVEEMTELLQWPGRAQCLLDLETHLNSVASLSRALWEMLSNPDATTDDKRTARAAMELAAIVADHASAARLVFHKDTSRRIRE